jgi:hypothetical protein
MKLFLPDHDVMRNIYRITDKQYLCISHPKIVAICLLRARIVTQCQPPGAIMNTIKGRGSLVI